MRIVKELIGFAMKRPEALSMGSAGHGSDTHLMGDLFQSMSLSSPTLSSVHSRLAAVRHSSSRCTRCPLRTSKASNSLPSFPEAYRQLHGKLP